MPEELLLGPTHNACHSNFWPLGKGSVNCLLIFLPFPNWKLTSETAQDGLKLLKILAPNNSFSKFTLLIKTTTRILTYWEYKLWFKLLWRWYKTENSIFLEILTYPLLNFALIELLWTYNRYVEMQKALNFILLLPLLVSLFLVKFQAVIYKGCVIICN